MSSKNDFIILLIGKSGSGKTTVAQALCETFGLTEVQSYTTRSPRYYNESGHIFINDSEFDNLTNIVAYTEFDGYRYCATQQQIEDNQIYIIDPDGAVELINKYTGNKTVYTLFFDIPNRVLIKRMRKRGDSYRAIFKRILNDRDKFPKNWMFDLTAKTKNNWSPPIFITENCDIRHILWKIRKNPTLYNRLRGVQL